MGESVIRGAGPYKRRFRWTLAGLALALLGVLLLSVAFGAVSLRFPLDELSREILFRVRLPRVVLAALVGAALSLSGLYFQYVMQNPLADAFTTGAAASSALGAVLALLWGPAGMLLPGALGGALCGLLLVLRVASVGGRILPVTMLLSGIVVSTFSSAAISLLKYLAEESLGTMVFWLMGGFQNASWGKLGWLVLVLALALLRGLSRAPALDLLAFDEESALSTGVPVYRLRREFLFWGALLCAVSVAFSGIIGFVGLIVPHLLRLAGFYRARELAPLSLLFGASFMALADLLSRTLLSGGQEIPVGVFTSTLGGIFFLHLLVRRRRELYELA
ncbi:iron ABC transporter permease [Thermosulfurimonas marina]|uniref:Iron ABC transporter permease n=1 Tax=Thermosulfurimonas marina TaxID=2047767 RepID=A0A6H1WTD0_9BACT|nr:iron ABC transporter permease [Thermosulfurimonas marina]QJA06430.1 iron ABC transporter permease [Thermosulfurimonas marina]